MFFVTIAIILPTASLLFHFAWVNVFRYSSTSAIRPTEGKLRGVGNIWKIVTQCYSPTPQTEVYGDDNDDDDNDGDNDDDDDCDDDDDNNNNNNNNVL